LEWPLISLTSSVRARRSTLGLFSVAAQTKMIYPSKLGNEQRRAGRAFNRRHPDHDQL
jgi:hypothetical protein